MIIRQPAALIFPLGNNQTPAIESRNIINFDMISQDVGVARTTISSYYQILEDCLIAERIEPFTNSLTRKKLVKSPKYLFFDLGLRRLAAQEQPTLPHNYLGSLFLRDYPQAKKGFVVCRVSNPQVLGVGIEAISWRDLYQKLDSWIDGNVTIN